MKMKTFLSLILAVALLTSSLSVFAADYSAGVGKDEIPYGEFGKENTIYKYDSFDMMTEDEAKAAGVPEGYSGYVLAISSKSSGMGIGLDLSQYRVKDIEKITFRVWCPEGTKDNGVRLTNFSNSSWLMLANPGATEQWVDVVLDETSNFNTSDKSFNAFDDGTGYCKTVNFCIRYEGSNQTAYIDSITVELKAPDTQSPVIEYGGETVINTTAGKKLSVDATAYDEYDEANIAPEYIFSDGAVDENGLLLEGEHTCTVRFADEAGNSSVIELTLRVAPKDVIAPVLNWAPDKLFGTVGMRPVLNVTASDDLDGDIVATLVWSEGALDSRGRLTSGDHTLTVTATDTTGNKTEKVISVTVNSEGLPNVG